jgi:hypothetical protein
LQAGRDWHPNHPDENVPYSQKKLKNSTKSFQSSLRTNQRIDAFRVNGVAAMLDSIDYIG